jgi:quinol monooxygenase YgiN
LSSSFTASVAETSEVPVFVATYLEVIPPATDETASLLRREQEATRADEGLLWFEPLQRLDRPTQFLALSAWSHPPALWAHRSTPHVADLNQALAAFLAAPLDSRHHRGLASSEVRPPGASGLTVVTHVDLTPTHKDEAMVALQELAIRSRSHPGNRCFLVWQQLDRPNHFSLVETWTATDTQQAHSMADETQAFRRTIAPMLGALYDDRWYRPLAG